MPLIINALQISHTFQTPNALMVDVQLSLPRNANEWGHVALALALTKMDCLQVLMLWTFGDLFRCDNQKEGSMTLW